MLDTLYREDLYEENSVILLFAVIFYFSDFVAIEIPSIKSITESSISLYQKSNPSDYKKGYEFNLHFIDINVINACQTLLIDIYSSAFYHELSAKANLKYLINYFAKDNIKIDSDLDFDFDDTKNIIEDSKEYINFFTPRQTRNLLQTYDDDEQILEYKRFLIQIQTKK
jgi:hypothetical protein